MSGPVPIELLEKCKLALKEAGEYSGHSLILQRVMKDSQVYDVLYRVYDTHTRAEYYSIGVNNLTFDEALFLYYNVKISDHTWGNEFFHAWKDGVKPRFRVPTTNVVRCEMENKYKVGIEYKDGDPVWVGRLGDSAPGEYKGQIAGIAAKVAGLTVYIVEALDDIPGLGDWTCVSIPEGCIRRRLDE